MRLTLTRRVAREIVRDVLIRSRIEAGKSASEIGEHLGIGQAGYSKFEQENESQRRLPDEARLTKILTFLGFEDRLPVMLQFLEVARSSKSDVDHSIHLPLEIERYLGLEQAARSIVVYDPELIAGLLQTPAYARALIEYRATHTEGVNVEALLSRRIERQQLITDPAAAPFTMYVPERVLRTVIGSLDIQIEQLEHLLTLIAQHGVEIRVIPSGPVVVAAQRAGEPDIVSFIPPIGLGGLILLRITEKWQVAYAETIASAHYYNHPADMERIGSELGHLHRIAWSTELSASLIRQIIGEFKELRKKQ